MTQFATFLQNNPTLTVRVSGHTDTVGTSASNQTLSESRANAVRTFLIGQGVAPGRITAVGFGETRPAVDTGDAGNDGVPDRTASRTAGRK